MIPPSECWVCHVLFEEDQAFRLQVFERFHSVTPEAGQVAARQLVDEHYADVHTAHERSWI